MIYKDLMDFIPCNYQAKTGEKTGNKQVGSRLLSGSKTGDARENTSFSGVCCMSKWPYPLIYKGRRR